VNREALRRPRTYSASFCAKRLGASAIATATARRNSSANDVGRCTPNPAHRVLIIRRRNPRRPAPVDCGPAKHRMGDEVIQVARASRAVSVVSRSRALAISRWLLGLSGGAPANRIRRKAYRLFEGDRNRNRAPEPVDFSSQARGNGTMETSGSIQQPLTATNGRPIKFKP
jgi:hypothetical protein